MFIPVLAEPFENVLDGDGVCISKRNCFLGATENKLSEFKIYIVNAYEDSCSLLIVRIPGNVYRGTWGKLSGLIRVGYRLMGLFRFLAIIGWMSGGKEGL